VNFLPRWAAIVGEEQDTDREERGCGGHFLMGHHTFGSESVRNRGNRHQKAPSCRFAVFKLISFLHAVTSITAKGALKFQWPEN
jgi:hypothetical protein